MLTHNRTYGVYDTAVTEFYTPAEEMAVLDESMPNDKLIQMLRLSLNQSRDYWNEAPWSLEETDQKALPFIFNQEARPSLGQIPEESYSDNRTMRGMRSIKAYVTSRIPMPDLGPSEEDEYVKNQTRRTALFLYQHSMDEHIDQKAGAAVLNFLFRKRAYLKLRFDPMEGTTGDIVTDTVPPEDIVIDKSATYLGNPLRIHQRIRCSLDELTARYPNKKAELLRAYGVVQGRFTQLSREVTYYETWYTYLDSKGYPREGVCWWLADPADIVLDKQPNPNWIYTGDDARDRQVNLLSRPPKPFVGINYINLGRAFIDETSLFEQALPQQRLLDKRQRQWHKNIDYVNGRWIADKNTVSEAEATRMVNKGPKTIGMVDNKEGKPLNTILANIGAPPLPGEVYQSIIDTRNEIDEMLGVNSIFKGSTPGQKDTLGRDLLQNQQASSLQDDLVKSMATMMQKYYAIKLQMMRTYYNEDQSVQAKDADGSDLILTLSGDTIDPNIKIRVQADSVLPINRLQRHQDAKELYTAGKLDPLTAFQDMGYDDADVRAERVYKSQTDPLGYQSSIERGMDNNQAESDIQSIINGRDAKMRDSYDQDYIDYYNLFVTTNRFAQLEQPIKQAIVAHLAIVNHIAATQVDLQQTMLNEAGMLEPAPVLPGMPGAAQPAAPPGGGQAATPSPQPPTPVVE